MHHFYAHNQAKTATVRLPPPLLNPHSPVQCCCSLTFSEFSINKGKRGLLHVLSSRIVDEVIWWGLKNERHLIPLGAYIILYVTSIPNLTGLALLYTCVLDDSWEDLSNFLVVHKVRRKKLSWATTVKMYYAIFRKWHGASHLQISSLRYRFSHVKVFSAIWEFLYTSIPAWSKKLYQGLNKQ